MSSDACRVMLAKKWDDSIDPTGMWMSEKMDGVRAYWSGSKFYSRSGNVFSAPKFFTKDLPKEPLDGELFAGRGLFQSCVSIVRTRLNVKEEDWKFITYLVFDAPKRKGKFEQRLDWCKGVIDPSKESTYAAVVGHVKCTGVKHLKDTLSQVLAEGGEGLMLRKPKSAYREGRVDTLLKVKVFHDEEALVLGQKKGSGRCSAMMGHLECQLANGIKFSVGSGFTDADRRSPPKKGSVITVKYQELSNSGKPRFPVFLRVRGDVTWKEVCAQAKVDPPRSQAKKVPRKLKKQHTVLFSTIPSRDQLTGKKMVTSDDEGTAATDADVAGASSGADKPMCRYGLKCYRTNASHLSRFRHPQPSPPAADAVAAAGASTTPAAVVDDAVPVDDVPDRVSTSPQPDRNKVPCLFGSRCFRTSSAHLARYSHDPANDPPAFSDPTVPDHEASEDEEGEEEDEEEDNVVLMTDAAAVAVADHGDDPTEEDTSLPRAVDPNAPLLVVPVGSRRPRAADDEQENGQDRIAALEAVVHRLGVRVRNLEAQVFAQPPGSGGDVDGNGQPSATKKLRS